MELKDISYNFKYKDIENIWHIFNCLSNNTFSSIELSYGKNGANTISCETMMSVLKTIEVIDFCCHRNAYSDGYTLIRKFRDDLMQYLFILNVIQNKHGLSDKEFQEYPLEPEFILKVINKNIEILINGERKLKAELAMEKWIYDELDNLENIKDRKNSLVHLSINHT